MVDSYICANNSKSKGTVAFPRQKWLRERITKWLGERITKWLGERITK
jgi:predicted DNA-binding transcriptional regulator AlpA